MSNLSRPRNIDSGSRMGRDTNQSRLSNAKSNRSKGNDSGRSQGHAPAEDVASGHLAKLGGMSLDNIKDWQ